MLEAQVKQLIGKVPLQVRQDASHLLQGTLGRVPSEKYPEEQVKQFVLEVTHVPHEASHATHLADIGSAY